MAYMVVNSRYNPFTFDEMIKPFAMYGDAYREQEAAIDAAREKEFSGSNLDQTLDKTAYDMYNSATTSLRGVADELATNGLSPELRGRIKSVARDYKTTMDALNDAQTRLYAEQDRRAKMGPDYVYQQNNLRIGDFLNGATPNQKGESLEKITKDIGTEFTARAQRITQDTWNRAFNNNGRVIAGYYDVTTESGLSAAQLDTILSDADTWNSIMKDSSISDSQKALLQGFRNTIESKKRALDYSKYDDVDKSRIDEAITVGAHYGLGKVTHDYKVDRSYSPGGSGSSSGSKNLSTRLSHPWIQFGPDGNPVYDEYGSPKIVPGWKQDQAGRWISPNGQIFNGSSSGSKQTTERVPYIGVVVFDKNGKATSYGSDKEWNESKNSFSGRIVTSGDSLNERNKESLASILGVNPMDSSDSILEEATRRGIIVSVDGDGDKQKMVLRGTKTYISNAAPEEETEFNIDG